MSLLDFIKIVNTVYHGLDIKIEQRLSNVVTVKKSYENIVFERFEFILVSFLKAMNTEYHGLSIKM